MHASHPTYHGSTCSLGWQRENPAPKHSLHMHTVRTVGAHTHTTTQVPGSCAHTHRISNSPHVLYTSGARPGRGSKGLVSCEPHRLGPAPSSQRTSQPPGGMGTGQQEGSWPPLQTLLRSPLPPTRSPSVAPWPPPASPPRLAHSPPQRPPAAPRLRRAAAPAPHLVQPHGPQARPGGSPLQGAEGPAAAQLAAHDRGSRQVPGAVAHGAPGAGVPELRAAGAAGLAQRPLLWDRGLRSPRWAGRWGQEGGGRGTRAAGWMSTCVEADSVPVTRSLERENVMASAAAVPGTGRELCLRLVTQRGCTQGRSL